MRTWYKALQWASALAALGLVFSGQSARAAALYWDTSTAAGIQGGAGTWATTGAFWSTSSGGSSPLANWSNTGVDAWFTSTDAASSVTLTTTVTANSMTITGSAFTFSGGTIATGTGGITLGSATADATINSAVTLLGAQTWTVTNSARTLTVTGAVTNGGYLLTVAGSGTTTISGSISGLGGLTKNDPGTLTLGASNTYGGGTTISGGVLQAGNDGALGAIAAPLTVNGGTLDTNGHSLSCGALSGSGTIDQRSSVSLWAALSVGNGNTAGTFSGRLQDTYGQLSLIKTGTSVFTFLGNADLAGSFLASGGTFNQAGGSAQVASVIADGGTFSLGGTALLSASSQTIGQTGAGVFTQTGGTNTAGSLLLGSGSAASGTYNLNGGLLVVPLISSGSGSATFNLGGGTLCANGSTSVSMPVVLTGSGGAGTINSGTSTATLSGRLSGSGGLVVAGSGTLVLAASNTYSGGTTINGGLLQVGVVGALGSTSALLTVSSGTLDLYGRDLNVGALGGGGVIDNSMGVSTLTVGNGNASGTFSGTIQLTSGPQLNLIKTGTGALGLTGNVTFSNGSVVVSGGTLNQTAGYVQVWQTTIDGAYNLAGNAQLSTTGGMYVGNSATGTFTQSGGTNSLYSGNLRLGTVLGTPGTYNLSGSGLLAVPAGSEYLGWGGPGTLTQSGGTNIVGYSLYLGTWSTGSGTYNLNGGLLSVPAGYEYLGSAGTGTVTQSGGTNAVGSGLYLSNSSGSSGTYNLNGGLLVVSQILVGSGSRAFNLGGGTISASAPMSVSMPIALTGNGGAGTFNTSTYTSTFSGQLSGSGALVVAGSGTLSLAGSNSYTGGTTLTGGVLQAGNNAALGSSTASLTVSGGTLDLHGYSLSVGSLSGGGAIDNLSGTGSLTAGNGNASSTFGGTIQDTAGQLSLTKVGTGVLGITGNLNLAGSVTVSGGTLNHSGGTISAPTVSVDGATYSLFGAPRLSTSTGMYIGNSGTGTFTQSGGTNATYTNALVLGNSAGARGTYLLSGSGLISLPAFADEDVGYSGTGIFVQSGGTNSVGRYLYLGCNGGASGTYTLTDGLLSARYECIGASGSGTFTQSGGTNSVETFYLGYLNYGVYNLNGGAFVVTQIPSGSVGTFNLGGGTIAANGAISPSLPMVLTGSGGAGTINTGTYACTFSSRISGSGALVVAGSGTLVLAASNSYTGGTTLTGGVLQAGNNAALGSSSASLTVSGGTLDVHGYSLSVGSLSGGGTIDNLSGNGSLSVGNGNTSSTFGGTIQDTAGQLSLTKVGTGVWGLTGNLNLVGSVTVSGGTLSQTAGSLQVPTATVDGGTYGVSGTGALWLPSGTEYLGYSGTGTLTQSGGTNSVANLYLGYNSVASRGIYNLSGSGLLLADNEYVGNNGTGAFTQSGGTHSVGTMSLGASSTYTLSAGQLTGQEELVYPITGLFQQSGGLNSVGLLTVNGKCLLTGGTLQVNGGLQLSGGTLSGGAGTASVTGSNSLFDLEGSVVSTNSISLNIGPNSLLIISSTLNPLTAFKTYSNSGLTHTAGTTLTLTAGQGFSGWGNINGPVVCQGTITATPSGWINLWNGLQMSGTSNVSLGNGTLYITDSASGISGGGLSAAYLTLVGSGTGTTFTQSSGTTTLAIALNYNASGGTYNLNGGLLAVRSMWCVGGNGIFDLGGGTLAAGGPMSVSVPFVLTGSGGNGTVDTAGFAVTLSGGLSGPGGFTKSGSGSLMLVGPATYAGSTTVSGGTLQFNGTNLALGAQFIRSQAGAVVQYAGATISGGFLRGPGTHTTLPGATNNFSGVTTYASTDFEQNGPTTFTNFTNGGQVTNSVPLTWDGGVNDGGGTLVVNNTVTAGDFTNAGVITINSGGALNNHLSNMTSYGGGRIYIDSGGTLNANSAAEGTTLDLQDSLLTNYGTVTGTTNVYYGATLAGYGSFGAIYVLQGGTLGVWGGGPSSATSVTINQGAIAGNGVFGLPVVLTATAAAIPSRNSTLQLAGRLSGSGQLIESGSGTLVLTASNSYTGGTNVSAGTLDVNTADALPRGGNLTIGSTGHVVLVSGLAHAISLGGLTITSGAGVGQASPLVQDTGQAGSLTYAGSQAGSLTNEAAPTPEPGTLLLLTAALAVGAIRRCKKRRKRNP